MHIKICNQNLAMNSFLDGAATAPSSARSGSGRWEKPSDSKSRRPGLCSEALATSQFHTRGRRLLARYADMERSKVSEREPQPLQHSSPLMTFQSKSQLLLPGDQREADRGGAFSSSAAPHYSPSPPQPHLPSVQGLSCQAHTCSLHI